MEDYTNKTEEDLLEILEDLNEQQEMFEEDLDDRDYKMMYDKNAQEIIKINAALSELNTDAPVEQDLESSYNPSGADSPPAEEFVETVEEQDLESRYNPAGADSTPAEEFVETVEEIETKPIEIKQVSQENLDNIKFSDIKVDNSLFFAKGGAIYEGDKVKIKDSGTTMKVTDISKNKKDQVEFSGEKGSYLIGDIEKMAKGGKVKRYIVHKGDGYDGEVLGSSDTFRGASMIQKRLEKKGAFDDVDTYGIKDTDDYFYRRKDNKYAEGGFIKDNYWGIDKGEYDELIEEKQLDLGKWFLYYNEAMKEWEATMDGNYTHTFKSLNDLMERKNEIDLYEYDEELTEENGEEVITNSKGEIRKYAKGGSVRRTNISPLLRYTNFEDGWVFNLVKLNPLRNQDGLKYKGNYKYGISRQGPGKNQEVWQYATLEEANKKYDELIELGKTYSKIKTKGNISKNYAKGGIVWKKNIGDDGWSSTMENESAYDNEGGYISESGNWKIYRKGRFYEREDGYNNFKRDGDWIVMGMNEYGQVEDFKGHFDTLSEAKKYVERWIEINPEDYAKGGTIDKNLTYKGEVVGFKGDDTGGAVFLGDIDIPKNSTPKSIIELAKSKFKRTWYVEVSKDGEYLYEIADDSYKGEYPMVTAYAKGGELNKGDVVRQTGKFAESGDYYVVEKDKGNKDEEAENYYQLSEVRKKEQGWFEESDLEKLYAEGGEIFEFKANQYAKNHTVKELSDIRDRLLKTKNLSKAQKENLMAINTAIGIKRNPEYYKDKISFAKGGETDSPITNYKKNIMGTTSFDLKVKGMRKPQDFIVYPITEKTDKIRIQSDKKFGEIHLPTGKGVLSKSGNTSWHLASDMMNRNVNTFELSEAELQEFVNQIKSTSGKSVGSSFVKSDNSGARLLEDGGKLDMNEIDIYQGLDGDYTIVMHGDVYEMNHHTMPNMSIDMYAGNRAEFPADISHWGKIITYEKAPIIIKNKIEKRAEEYNKQFAKGGEVSDKRQRVAEFLVVMDYDNGFYDEELDREYGSVTPEEAIEWELKNRIKTDEDADYYIDDDGELVMEKGGKLDLKKFDKEIAEQIDILESMIKEEKDEGLRKELMEEIEKMKKVL